MARRDITIIRAFPVINGFVQVPPVGLTDTSRVTIAEAIAAIDGTAETALSQGSGNTTGRGYGAQTVFTLPALNPGETYDTDPVDVLADY